MNQLNLTYEPKLNEDQKRIWYFVKRCEGRDSAISMPNLAGLAFDNRKSTRRVQTSIKQLIELGFPIGSSCGKPNGYYIITTADEFDAADDQLRRRIIQIAKRRKALKKHRPPLAGQQTLECGDSSPR